MRESKKDYLVLFSGGYDSTVLLHELNARKGRTEAVYFDYGSNTTEMELEYVRRHCTALDVPLMVIKLADCFNKSDSESILLTGGDDVIEHLEDDNIVKNLEVPFRNGIFISVATSLAVTRGLQYVAIASGVGNCDKEHQYADCSDKFIASMQRSVRIGSDSKVRLYAPYTQITKQDVADRAKTIEGLDVHDTYSCYVGKKEPCGKCPGCIERQKVIDYGDKQNDL